MEKFMFNILFIMNLIVIGLSIYGLWRLRWQFVVPLVIGSILLYQTFKLFKDE